MSLNKKGIEKYLTWLLDNGAQSISICVSTGENAAMNKVIQIKPYILTPVIFVLCIIGSYALRNNLFDVGAMLIIALIGYFFIYLEIPIAPVVLALILGPMLESNLRRSLLMSGGSFTIFFTRPISILFLLLAVISLLWPLLRKKMEANTGAKAE